MVRCCVHYNCNSTVCFVIVIARVFVLFFLFSFQWQQTVYCAWCVGLAWFNVFMSVCSEQQEMQSKLDQLKEELFRKVRTYGRIQ